LAFRSGDRRAVEIKIKPIERVIMSEITRVPLQPVAKGSLGKLWLGAVVAVALGVPPLMLPVQGS
jgi:hypothetical protein